MGRLDVVMFVASGHHLSLSAPLITGRDLGRPLKTRAQGLPSTQFFFLGSKYAGISATGTRWRRGPGGDSRRANLDPNLVVLTTLVLITYNAFIKQRSRHHIPGIGFPAQAVQEGAMDPAYEFTIDWAMSGPQLSRRGVYGTVR